MTIENNDGIWESFDNGVTWVLVAPSADYIARQLANSAKLFDEAPTIDNQ